MELANLHDKKIEQSVIGISAGIEDTIEMLTKAKEITASSEEALIKAHLKVEELYMILQEPPQ